LTVTYSRLLVTGEAGDVGERFEIISLVVAAIVGIALLVWSIHNQQSQQDCGVATAGPGGDIPESEPYSREPVSGGTDWWPTVKKILIVVGAIALFVIIGIIMGIMKGEKTNSRRR
jgi:hypothetical protein